MKRPVPPAPTPRLLIAPAILLAFAACTEKTGTEDAPEPSTPAPAPASGGEASPGPTGEVVVKAAGDEPKKAEPPKLSSLHPLIGEQGPEGMPPDKIVVELSRPVLEGAKLEGTQLRLEPELEGSLSIGGPSTLVFTPSEPWAPRTKYTATLTALSTKHGMAEVDGTFARVIETPPFALERADIAELDMRRRRVRIELQFTGPVSVSEVKRHVAVTTEGGANVRIQWSATSRPNVLRGTLTGAQVAPGVRLQVRLRSGLGMTHGLAGVAPANTLRLQIPEGEQMQVFAAHVEEGSSGFYIRVVCTDDAFSTKRMYFWDNKSRNSWRVSSRCVLDGDDAKDSLHFEPKVDFEIAPTRGGFRILGDFARGSYSMRLDADARTIDGGVLKSTFSETFSIPARKPQLSFLSQGRYLPREAWKNLGIRHLNVGEATLEVRRIRPANLVFWMSADSETATDRNSDLVLKEKIGLTGAPDTLTTSWVDVAKLVPDAGRGVLAVRISGENSDVEAKARILVTDMNLVAKHQAGTDETRVWALDMHTGEPLDDVEVEQVVMSGRAISRCETDGAAGCVLAGVSKDAVDPAKPFALIATRGKDLTYLKYDELRTTPDAARVHGRPFRTEAPYTAAIYSDRGVYRPGETAHVVSILRDQAKVAPPAGMPVSIELVDPRSKVVKRFTEKTNPAGMVAVDLAFADYADTGVYAVRVNAGKKLVGSYRLNVEEFVPERMKVKARAVKEDLLRTDRAEVQVEARYLFGGSAEGSRYEVRCELAPARFSPETNGNYQYGVWREKDPRNVPLGSATGTLDAEGKGTLACPSLTSRGGFSGPARLDVQVAVFESGSGRTTQTQARAWVHPSRHYVGLMTGTEKLKAGEAAKIDGVVVDWSGKAVDAVDEVELELFRVEREHDWVYDDGEGRWSYRQYSRLAKEGSQRVSVKGGKFSARFTAPGDAAAFVVRAKAGDAQADLQIEGHRPYWWSWTGSSGQDRTPRPLKPATLPLKVPKEVKVGDEIAVEFTPPFKGRALVSLETDGVATHAWLDVEAKPTVWKAKVKAFSPNVYASVFVVKDPHLESKQAFLPNRAFGVRSVKIRPEAFMQTLNVRTPEEVRSNSTLKVELDFGALEEPMFVTVAAVDEGILQLTKFSSPNPFDAIFDKRALGVETFETIGWNLLLPAGDVGRTTGGDSAAEPGGRVQPIKPVALWSGLREVPKSGKMTVELEVPEYRGSLRVMTVAAGNTRMAHASQNVTVRDPLVLQTTLPRFMTQGDEAQVPVFVTNLSGSRRAVKVSVEAKPLPVGGLHVDEGLRPKDVIVVKGPSNRSLVLDNEASGTVVFTLVGQQPVGAATLRVVVRSDDLVSEESLDVPFLPAAPKTRIVQRIELEAGRTDLLPYLQGWLPTTERSTFWVTANPYGDTFDHLKYLVRYPFGCIEQTTSTTRPLLFVGQLMSSVDPTLMADGRLSKMVMHGVNRVLSMQTPEGGFSYWPGARTPVPWGTAYGLHMLLDAKKLRYPVPQDRIDDALDWVERTLTSRYSSRSSRDWYYGRQSEAYLHYVLAMAGRGRKARMIKLLSEIERDRSYRYPGQREEDEYMLKAALYVAGDRRFEKDLRTPDTSPLELNRYNSWSFYSDRRRRGFVLSTYADLFGADPRGEPLAQLVAEGLRGHHSSWYTTQELVWGITGLGKYIGELTKTFSPAKLYANGEAISAQDVEVKKASGEKIPPDTGERTWSLYRASEYGSLELEVKKEEGQKIYLILSSEGVRKGASYQTGGEGLALRRSYRTASGEPYDLSSGDIELGDVIYAVVEIDNETGERVQNIALVDRFPAGWEIENPRLSRGGGTVDWIDRDELWSVDYMNLRDDRVEVFGALERGQSRSFVYALRAVTAGTFTSPPVEAEAMYDPSRWAREAGGKVVITGPWEAAAEP